MILTTILKSLSVLLIAGMIIVLYLLFKKLKLIIFLISLLILLLHVFKQIQTDILMDVDPSLDFWLTILLSLGWFLTFPAIAVLLVYLFKDTRKKVKPYYFWLTLLNIAFSCILCFYNLGQIFHDSDYVMEKRTEVVQQLLRNPEDKEIVVEKPYEGNAKLAEKYRWLSEYGEIAIGTDVIEFYFNQGTMMTPTYSYMYFFGKDRPNPDGDRIRKIDEHWYYISYGYEDED